MIITIDGPAGVGKSTIAKMLASKLNYSYFDTGAMYRAVTYAIIKNKIDPESEKDVLNFLKNNFQYKIEEDGLKKKYFVNDEDVTDIIRSNYITSLVSSISSKKYIRETLVPIQRSFVADKNIICEGRDMGTSVFPNADLKIYLTARVSVRAERRFRELIDKYPQDIANLDRNKILEDIQKRDEIDSTRKVSPLRKAEDAYLIDTSNLTIDEVVKRILKRIKKSKPRLIYRFIIAISKFFLITFYGYKVYGRENLIKGAAIITSNHVSFLDPPAIAVAIDEEIHFLAKEPLFKIPIFKNLIRILNSHPISEKESNIQTIKKTNNILRKGYKVLLFPEGARSEDGQLTKLLPGVGFLISLTKATIIPAYIHGAHEAWNKKKKFPKLFKKISCVFGTPIRYEEFENVDKELRIPYILTRIEGAIKNLQKWSEDGFKGNPP
ncbi:MAG: (d)CMP kinase [Parachlamydiales bacterium]|jgi:cytidylate kinase